MERIEISGQNLKRRLDELVSPRLSHLGVTWRGDYFWVEEGATPMRRVVGFYLLKGASAVMAWGYSLSFVPLVAGSRLQYHRTFKSAHPTVFEWPESYARSFSGGGMNFRKVIVLAGEFESTLASFLDAELPVLAAWLARVQSLQAIEEELRRQIATPSFGYRVHHPQQDYVLPFARIDLDLHAQLIICLRRVPDLLAT
jgi:hypothetical protein